MGPDLATYPSSMVGVRSRLLATCGVAFFFTWPFALYVGLVWFACDANMLAMPTLGALIAAAGAVTLLKNFCHSVIAALCAPREYKLSDHKPDGVTGLCPAAQRKSRPLPPHKSWDTHHTDVARVQSGLVSFLQVRFVSSLCLVRRNRSLRLHHESSFYSVGTFDAQH